MTRKALLLAGILAVAAAGSATWLTSQASTSAKDATEPSEQVHGQEQRANGTRLALVLANSNYVDAEAPLPNLLEDSRMLGDELQRSGFAVSLKQNVNKQDMKAAVDEFLAAIKPGSTALLFFDGFAIQAGRRSYMIPVDAQIWKEANVMREGVSIESVLAGMNQRGAGVKLAMIDGARRNPFERRFRGFSRGLASIDTPEGALIIYANSPGRVETENGTHAFVTELVSHLRSSNLSAQEVFSRTAKSVAERSGRSQVPFVSSSLIDDFYFGERPLTAREQTASRKPAGERYASAEPVLPASSASRRSDALEPERVARVDQPSTKGHLPRAARDSSDSASIDSNNNASERFEGWWTVTKTVVTYGSCRPKNKFEFRVTDGRINGSQLFGRVKTDGSLTGYLRDSRESARVIGRLKSDEASIDWASLREGCRGRFIAVRE
jgi:uncharacterized caspase-like protein